MGYFAGSVYAGAKAHSDDVKEQQEVVTGFLDFVAGKIPVGGSFSLGDTTLGQDVIKSAVESAIKDPGMEPARRLELAALPQRDGELSMGDAITSAFDTTFNRASRAEP